MNPDWLQLDISERVATIRFNRPEARNALTREITARCTDYLLQVNADPNIRCLILRGSSGHFVSGGDIDGFAQDIGLSPEERSAGFRRRVSSLSLQIELLQRLKIPVIAVTEGTVAGAGLSYVLASDYVLASTDTRFLFAHIHMGLPLDMGMSYFLPRVVGLTRARKLALTGAKMTAQEALDYGLISEVADNTDLETALLRVSAHFLSLPAAGLAGIKREFAESYGNDVASQISLEAELVSDCVTTEDFVARITAFAARE